MKNVYTFFLLAQCLLIIAGCSYKIKGKHTVICFDNTSDKYLYVFSQTKKNTDTDTLCEHYSAFGQKMYHVPQNTKNETALHLREWDTYEDRMPSCDYLAVFVWDRDSVTVTQYKDGVTYKGPILVRYDLTLDDMFFLEWTVSFPPNERMRGIHMWPSYEELVEKYGRHP